ncbi:hypothetical protein [Dyadobacter luteus]|jgi:hypothetical protein|uniref:hypothetical protein n=1 Tax=Dyadobacter luteus TaxID=2259619 RepID=UPI0018F411E8|nr:hypothetical protein [Dyadobacter luteus]
MKQAQTSKTSGGAGNGIKRTENKDNLDSRHKEEEMVKGNHITNNQKETRSTTKSK